jgi:transposase
MKATYSEAFIEQALVKVFSRGQRTIKEVAAELHINLHTLKNWMKRTSVPKNKAMPTTDKRPADWTAAEKLTALHETHGLSGEALSAWCREKGLFAHHLTSWKEEFCAPKTPMPAAQMRTLKDENVSLKKAIQRKDKALAEAAALLVLQKKFRALWEDEEK